MKKILIGALLALATVAHAATKVPVQMLDTTSSTSGQVVVSGGPSGVSSWGSVSLGGLTPVAANTVLANATGSTATPTAFAMPSCSGTNNALRWTAGTGFTCASSIALTSSGLNQFAATTSAQLASVISDETGSGPLVFATSPTLGAATFTGNTTLGYASPNFILNDTSGTGSATAQFASNGTIQWIIQKTSSNNLNIGRFNAGSQVDQPISISNSTGLVSMPDGLSVGNLTATGTVSGITGRLLGVQVFTASGTYTPTSGTGRAIIRVQAPGGGGGGSTTTGSGQVSIAQGGSSGSYAEAYWTSPSTQTVTIGAVGAAGASGGTGGTGGTTSVGSIVSCPGGNGGATQAASTPPLANGGAAAPSACTVSGATLILSRPGSAGQIGAALSTTQYWPVQGGISSWGAYTTGYGFGGVGSAIGQSTSGVAGFAAGAGFVIVYDYQ